MLIKDAFIVMPFDNEVLDSFYRKVIKPILKERNYQARRVDEMPLKEQIVERIIHSIEDSDMILCDLTSINPNVMYELGIAHSLTQRVIMIAQKDQKLPFDLKDYEVIFYDPKNTKHDSIFVERLNAAIDEINRDGLSNPVQKFSRMNTELMNVSVNFRRQINSPYKVLSAISSYVEKDYKLNSNSYGIAITGASCLGKTIFAGELSKYLNNHNVETSVVSLDGYMKPRRFQEENKLAGPCEEAHDLISLKNTLIELMYKNNDIKIPFFDHSTGLQSPNPKTIKYSPVIILEGMTAFSDSIEEFINLHIFMEGEHQWIAKKLRFLVSLEQRNRSINNSRASAEREYLFYRNYLAQKKKQANIVIIVKDDWRMHIDDSHLDNW